MSLRTVGLAGFGFLFLAAASASQTTTAPTITSLSPHSGAPGDQIQITGTNLGYFVLNVVFTGPNGTQISTTVAPSPTILTLQVPRLAATGPVFVLVPDGQGGFNQTNTLNFTRAPGLRIRASKRDISAGERDDLLVAFFGTASPQVVQWSADVGAIDAGGHYTAPGSLQTDQFANITGCLQGTSICDSITLGLHPLRITPDAPVVKLEHDIDLQATVGGSLVYPVWHDLSGVGTLESTGEYQAPEFPHQGGSVSLSAEYQGSQAQTFVGVTGGFPGLVNRLADYVDSSSFTLPSRLQPTSVAVSDTRAYVLSSPGPPLAPGIACIDVYDIKDPVHPVWLGSAESATDGNLFLSHHKLYSVGQPRPFNFIPVMAAYEFRGELPVLNSWQVLPDGAPWTFAQGIVTAQEQQGYSADSPAFVDQFFPAEPSGQEIKLQLPAPFSGAPYTLTVLGARRNRLYAAAYQVTRDTCLANTGNLVSYDISENPARLVSFAALETTTCLGGQLAGEKYAVVGQQVFNISSDPPISLGSLPEAVNVMDGNDHLLVGTTYQTGIRVFETDGTSFVKETETLLDCICIARDIRLSEDHVYAAENEAGLAIYDISQPGGVLPKPQVIGVFGTAYARVSTGKYLFAARGTGFAGALTITDVTQDPPVQLAAVITGPVSANDLAVVGRSVYVGTSQDLLLYDVSTPSQPALVATFGMAVNALHSIGDFLYIGLSDGRLSVANISTPSSPVLVDTIGLPDKPIQITSQNNRLLVADRTGGLLVFDISNPANPVFQSQVKVGRAVVGVQGDGNLALLAALEQGLVIVDLDVPQPTIISSLAFDSYNPFQFGSTLRILQNQASSIVLNHKIAFVGTFTHPADFIGLAGTNGMLYGIDYTHPEHPRLVSLSAQGAAIVDGIVSLGLAGDDLFVAIDFRGEQHLNVAQPRNSINLFYPPSALQPPLVKLQPLPPAQASTKF